MLLPFALALVMQDAPRLRTLLPNGTVIMVEEMPRASYVSVHLFARFDTFEPTEQHGQRHLLEHLILRGKDGRLDTNMEKQGMFLTGHTLRDALQVEITCGPDQLQLAFDAMKEIIEVPIPAPQDIAHESAILIQELAVIEDSLKLASAGWAFSYGAEGLDPLGTVDRFQAADAERLGALQKEIFKPQNLAVVISGPVSTDLVTRQASAVFEPRAGDKPAPVPPRGKGIAGRTDTNAAFGEARGALVRSYKEPDTAWALAAGLAIATQVEDAFFIYTPTTKNGLMFAGQTGSNSGFGLIVDELDPADAAALFPVGKQLAIRWYKGQLGTPSGNSSLRGLLLAQGASNKPEVLLENLNEMTWQDFLKGLGKYKQSSAVAVVGNRR